MGRENQRFCAHMQNEGGDLSNRTGKVYLISFGIASLSNILKTQLEQIRHMKKYSLIEIRFCRLLVGGLRVMW